MQMEFKIEFNTLVARSNFYSINENATSWDTQHAQGGGGRWVQGGAGQTFVWSINHAVHAAA